MTDCNIEERYIEVPGGQIFVRIWTPQRVTTPTPMVLLHDSLGCVDLWRDFPAALAMALSRPVIAYDRLGFGKSSLRDAPPSSRFINEEADVYFPAIRRALGVHRCSLMGHSVGGAMAVVIAGSGDFECEAVITESAQAFVADLTLQGIRAAKADFHLPGKIERLEKWHGDKARWVLDAWTEVWLSNEFSGWSLDAHLGAVQCPVLAIHGDLDEFGPEDFPRTIVEGVSGPAEMTILSGCGHVPHREQSSVVLERISGFLATHDVQAARDECVA
ncbi:alpha/beta hydrolase [Sinimarinibacterium sp. CAU 1509]|uniref:alpha/beta fold hydrolase n=1 Tax=Sinimarinibacterium sp. CAU 1509 TaxID=2562283 RepID=UPI0010AC739B|nr:alpha/beta hydrolase [Sinimarinibacterium sp. CAU 1509]TJY62935.1 alpha/beta hydrolase [Sinimarinibacterium sp. CAU 1509]